MQSGPAPSAGTESAVRRDAGSVLKRLTKDVEIGSTVDPSNGDKGPHSLQMAAATSGEIEKGDLLVCDFSDFNGVAGKGTSVELLSSSPGAKPRTFAQGSQIEGCDGAAVTAGDAVYAAGLTSKELCPVNAAGRFGTCFTSPGFDPLADGYGSAPPGKKGRYSPVFIFVGDVGSGSVEGLSLGAYGTGKMLAGVGGFPVTADRGFGTLGPSGLGYDRAQGTLYVADGACNAVVAIDNVPKLSEKDEIVVGAGCKTFACKEKQETCARLVKAGDPLDKPEALAMLPNGNLIVANTANNELVEMTPAGQVLDTRVVDRSKTAGIYALWATGRNDRDTALFYTDTNSNTVQELER